MSKPIALQLYTLREALARDWKSTLAEVAALGYVGVETAGFDYAPSPAAVVDELQRLGLKVAAAHIPLPTEANIGDIAAVMHALGSDRIVLGGTGHENFGTAADIDERSALFNGANALARAHGLRFGLHNHWWEFSEIDGRYAYDRLLDQLDPEIFVELDVYWLQTAGVDPVHYVAQQGTRAPLLHIKDGPCTLAGDMVAVGGGNVDIAAIIAAAPAAEWLIVELDRCATDMLTAVAESYTYLTRHGLSRGNR
jgi:sugar phosphate isomerase/epimerase